MTKSNSPAGKIEQEFAQWRLDNALGLQAISNEVRASVFRMKLQELAQKHGLK